MMRRITDQEEVKKLAITCNLPTVTDNGEDHVDRMIVLGWGEPLRGAFLLEPINKFTVEAHVITVPEARGREAITMGRNVLSLLHKQGMRAIGITPKDRPDALAFAKLTGMRVGGETHTHWFSFGGANG